MNRIFRPLIAILIASVFVNSSCKPTDYSSDINALKLRCDSLAAELEITNANLQATNNTLESLSTTITLIQSQIVTISEQISKLNSLLVVTSTIVSDHSADIDYIQSQIIEIQDQVADLNTKHVETSSTLSILSTAIISIQSRITTILGRVDSLSINQTAAEESLSDLNTSLAASNRQLSDLTLQFNTSLTQLGLVIDIEGNIYHTVTIGKQVWMVENLRSTKFRNGDTIPYFADSEVNGCCWYNDDITNKNTYGAIYNYSAVMDTRNLCPLGWHIPTSTEWRTLSDILGGNSLAGGKLKEPGTLHWLNPNVGGTSVLGFKALPGGVKNCTGNFESMGEKAQFWVSSPAAEGFIKVISIYQLSTQLDLESIPDCNSVYVRCVKDREN